MAKLVCSTHNRIIGFGRVIITISILTTGQFILLIFSVPAVHPFSPVFDSVNSTESDPFANAPEHTPQRITISLHDGQQMLGFVPAQTDNWSTAFCERAKVNSVARFGMNGNDEGRAWKIESEQVGAFSKQHQLPMLNVFPAKFFLHSFEYFLRRLKTIRSRRKSPSKLLISDHEYGI